MIRISLSISVKLKKKHLEILHLLTIKNKAPAGSELITELSVLYLYIGKLCILNAADMEKKLN